jgi:hypothetical protein
MQTISSSIFHNIGRICGNIEATNEILWIRKILEDLQEKQSKSTPLLVDNTYAIKLATNPRFHDQTKNINTKYHLDQYHVEAKTIHLRHCSTNEKIANMLDRQFWMQFWEKEPKDKERAQK